MWNEAQPCTHDAYYCLCNQQAPARDQESTSKAKAAQKRGGCARVRISVTSPAPCPICQTQEGPHPEQLSVTPPQHSRVARVWALPTQGLFCPLPHPPSCNTIITHPCPSSSSAPCTPLCPQPGCSHPAGVPACTITAQAGMGMRSQQVSFASDVCLCLPCKPWERKQGATRSWSKGLSILKMDFTCL